MDSVRTVACLNRQEMEMRRTWLLQMWVNDLRKSKYIFMLSLKGMWYWFGAYLYELTVFLNYMLQYILFMYRLYWTMKVCGISLPKPFQMFHLKSGHLNFVQQSRKCIWSKCLLNMAVLWGIWWDQQSLIHSVPVLCLTPLTSENPIWHPPFELRQFDK